MNKLTKIVATIGPPTDSEEKIRELINAGVNVFRFNFKHGSVEWHSERIERVNKVAHEMGASVGTLIDLQGPELRINMPYDSTDIEKGELLVFGEEAFEKKEKGISVTHPDIIPHLIEGQKCLAEDGTFSFLVERKDGKTYLRCETAGNLKQRKNFNIPGAEFPFPVLVERDFEGLELAVRHRIDYVALSFVRSANDLKVVREEMKKMDVHALMMSKIENQKAIDNLDEIIENSDAMMVARGDLGVELPMEQVPYYQKMIIRKCSEKGIPVITATQMLQSMTDNPVPYRAEVSDIANATYDLTDAVMLSGETASGKYPLEAVTVMAKTASFNETKFLTDTRTRYDYRIEDVESMICDAAYNLYLRLREMKKAPKGFLVFTHSGRTARLISRYRPKIPVYAFTSEELVRDQLTLNFGVFPFLEQVTREGEVKKVDVASTLEYLKNKSYVEQGDSLIVLHGDVWAIEGGTSTIKVVTCK